MLRSMKYGLYGAVLSGLIAAPVLWTSVDKSVHLVIDGQASTVHTTAGRVSGVLDGRGLEVGAHDLLAPAATSKVRDGMHVVLRRGRLLELSVDGKQTQVWTTAATVDEALAELGYSTSDFVSVSRSRRLPLGPTAIAIRTPRLVTVVHDGKHELVSTTDATVGQLLDEIGLAPGPADKLSVPRTALLVQGETITLRRVGKKTVTRTESLAYRTSRQNDPKLEKGTTRVITPGRNGMARVTYSMVYVDGRLVGQTKIKTMTVAKPRTMVLGIGTKRTVIQSGGGGGAVLAGGGAAVPSAGIPSAGSAKDIARQLLQTRGWGGQQQYDCLVLMWNHESGWRVNAANPSGAYGIPQALPGSKMSAAGPDWQTSAKTQITWGLNYIGSRYGTPCGAWSFWQSHSYY